MMLQRATGDKDGIYVKYHTDSSLFNFRCLQTHTKTLEELFWEQLFAIDALVARTKPAIRVYHLALQRQSSPSVSNSA